MAVLRMALVVAALGGCYAPDLRDCAVSCAADSDCGPGQVCGGDRMCAAPAVAGHCEPPRTPDAAVSDAAVGDAPRDAFVPPADAYLPPHDAYVPPDGPTVVALQLEIKGKGKVDVAGIGTCTDAAPNHICTFTVPNGVARTLHATAGEDFHFEKWESGACTGTNPTCTVIPTGFTATVAKFKH